MKRKRTPGETSVPRPRDRAVVGPSARAVVRSAQDRRVPDAVIVPRGDLTALVTLLAFLLRLDPAPAIPEAEAAQLRGLLERYETYVLPLAGGRLDS